jgi:Zinc finger, C2H2 type
MDTSTPSADALSGYEPQNQLYSTFAFYPEYTSQPLPGNSSPRTSLAQATAAATAAAAASSSAAVSHPETAAAAAAAQATFSPFEDHPDADSLQSDHDNDVGDDLDDPSLLHLSISDHDFESMLPAAPSTPASPSPFDRRPRKHLTSAQKKQKLRVDKSSSFSHPSASASTAASPPEKYTCGVPGCGKEFERRYNLKVHTRRHTGDTPYTCPVVDCAKKFRWRSSMAHHIKSHERAGLISHRMPIVQDKNISAHQKRQMAASSRAAAAARTAATVTLDVNKDISNKTSSSSIALSPLGPTSTLQHIARHSLNGSTPSRASTSSTVDVSLTLSQAGSNRAAPSASHRFAPKKKVHAALSTPVTPVKQTRKVAAVNQSRDMLAAPTPGSIITGSAITKSAFSAEEVELQQFDAMICNQTDTNDSLHHPVAYYQHGDLDSSNPATVRPQNVGHLSDEGAMSSVPYSPISVASVHSLRHEFAVPPATAVASNAASSNFGATSGVIRSNGVVPDASSIIAVLLQQHVDQSMGNMGMGSLDMSNAGGIEVDMTGINGHHTSSLQPRSELPVLTPFDPAMALCEPYDFDWSSTHDDDDNSSALF